MFGLSFAELAVVVLVVILLFGPDKLPEVARLIGRAYREMRKISNTVRDTIAFEDDFRDRDETYRYIVEEKPKQNNEIEEVVREVRRVDKLEVEVPRVAFGGSSVVAVEVPKPGVGECHREVKL